MKVPSKAWVKGGLWLAFFLSGLWVGLRVYGHKFWYPTDTFATIVDNHLEVTALSLLVCLTGAAINIRLGLAAGLAFQAMLAAITASLASDAHKWEIPETGPRFADTHVAELAQVFHVLSFVCYGLLFLVMVSVFWKLKGGKR